jgi:hypothetical protein
VVNGGALGTPSSGTVTNLTGTASININGTVGATTATTGAFTTVAASGALSVTAAATSTFRNDQNTDTGIYIRNDSAGAAAASRFDLYTTTAAALTMLSCGAGYTGTFAGVNLAKLRLIFDNAAGADSNGLMLASPKTIYIAPNNSVVGTFAAAGLTVTGTFDTTGVTTINSTVLNAAQFTMGFAGNTANGFVLNDSASASGSYYLLFEIAGTIIGSVTRNASTSAVLYNITSDYRTKDIYGPLTDAADKLRAIRVYDGKRHGAVHNEPLVLAHEYADVLPWAVTGEKDAVDDNGKPKYQNVALGSS